MASVDELVSVRDVAAALGVHPETIRRLIHAAVSTPYASGACFASGAPTSTGFSSGRG